MPHKNFNTLGVGKLVCLVLLAVSRPTTAQERLRERELRFFESKIRPVLIEHCYDCHSSDVDDPGGGLVLDSQAGLRQGGSSGPALIPGRPRSSLLWLAMKQTDKQLAMPPEDYSEKLPDEVIRDFERWIAAGAPDPRHRSTSDSADKEKAADMVLHQEDATEHWAWKFPRLPDIPDADNTRWGTKAIDRLVFARLASAGLTPSPPADRLTLVRRLAIDLTGLPPSEQDLQEFALRDDPRRLEDYVDQLLGSEQYGERFGRHWLDVARYAESTGKDVNVTYPWAWRYRDYAIDAFNADLPFNQFILEQLAGDLLVAEDEAQQRTRMIATGFLALGPKSVNEMNPLQFAVDVADEQIDTVSRAFLGVTIACARCHDHKFDPISQRDYTALAGIFLSTETHFGTTGGVGGRNRSSLLELPPVASEAVAEQGRMSPRQVAALEVRIGELEAQRRDLIRARLSGDQRPNDSTIAALRIAQQLNRLQLQLESVDEVGNPKQLAMGVTDKPAAPRFVRRRRSRSSDSSERFQRLRAARELNFVQDSPLLVRGEIDKPGETVPRGVPSFLGITDELRSQQLEIPSSASGRLQLAEWIASDQNPLTARVIVNRVWGWLLGEGLVPTEDNFGTSGEMPANQPLLDYLALEFIADGWSIKRLARRIVLSETYQQASDFRAEAFAVNPDNSLHWRANRRALDAESLRDGMLAISGRLVLERPSGSPIAEAGDGLIGGRRRQVSISESSIANATSAQRSIYLPIPRSVLPDALQLFDFADNSGVIGDRDLTIVPSQALYWMNNPQVEENCEAVARSLLNVETDQRSDRQLSRWPMRGQRWRDLPPPLQNRLRAWRMGGGKGSAPGGRRWAKKLPERAADDANPEHSRKQIEELFVELTIRVLARPPLPAETAAVVAYVQAAQRQEDSLVSIWTGVTRSLFSSADYRFLR